MVALVAGLGTLGSTSAGFEASTTNAGNSLVAASTFPRYPQTVLADNPSFYYRLADQPEGGRAADAAGGAAGAYDVPYTFGAGGAIGDGDGAIGFHPGVLNVPELHSSLVTDPQVFTEEVWFRTTTTTGGKLVGFEDSAVANDAGSYDRNLYLLDDGRLQFGVYNGSTHIVRTTTALNDGSWHHAAASLGPAGMALYVDGSPAASDSSVTSAQSFNGYWHVGSGNLNWWPDSPSRYEFSGDLDEVALFPTQLSAARVAAHYAARTGAGYVIAVQADGPYLYWRLGDAASAQVTDTSGNGRPGVVVGGPSSDPRTTTGATGDGDAAAAFTGNGSIGTRRSDDNPRTFSEECWFRTTTTTGGKLMGFSERQGGLASRFDRHIYMLDDGRLTFGVVNVSGTLSTITTPSSYNDGSWHHLVATDGTGGIKLYVDGVARASDSSVSGGEPYTGYWRVGGDTLRGWPNAPSNSFYVGDLDEAAVYPSELSAAQVAAHDAAGPGIGYRATVLADAPEFYWRLDEAQPGAGVTDSAAGSDDGLAMARYYPILRVPGPLRAGQVPTLALHVTGGEGIGTAVPVIGPQVFTIEFWVRTATTTGGKIVGFGSSATGLSNSYDRHVYMLDDGRVRFGVAPSWLETVTTPASYNDGAWHQVVASLGPAGQKLYVDGELRAANPSVTAAQAFTGYWRIGGDRLALWPGQPSTDFFTGDIAEVAVYPAQVSDEQVRVHDYANH